MRPIDCALERGEAGDLHLHLTRPDGSPAAFDFVTLVDAAGQKIRAAPTDATGRLDFEGLSAGTYFAIWADPLAGVGVSRPLVLAGDGTESQLDQTLPAGVDVLVACVACAAKPAGSMFLTSGGLLLNGGLPQLAGSRVFPADGVLALGRVSAGASYRLIWNDGRQSLQKAFVADRDRVTLELP